MILPFGWLELVYTNDYLFEHQVLEPLSPHLLCFSISTQQSCLLKIVPSSGPGKYIFGAVVSYLQDEVICKHSRKNRSLLTGLL